MSVPLKKLQTPPPPVQARETRDFRVYHDFLRAARNFMEGPLVVQMFDAYERDLAATGRTVSQTRDWREAEAVLDELTEFQFYNWCYRNLQRFKYHRPSFGIFATLERERERLTAELDAIAAQTPPAQLRLNANLELPDYYRYVPFHQHTGGVSHDALDGLAYEIGRRTTVPAHADPNGIYRILFEALPKKSYARVLDWGTGHGAALLSWQRMHPESECHGVDLSAPCLKVANARAHEAGVKLFLSQQDLEHLDYPDESFDLIFFNFMLHELPPARTPALLKEAARVLKPGGLFAGHEFHLRPGDHFQNVLQRSHAFTNNETYSTPWYASPIGEWALQVGFSKVSIEPFERLNRSVIRPGREPINGNYWNLYQFTK